MSEQRKSRECWITNFPTDADSQVKCTAMGHREAARTGTGVHVREVLPDAEQGAKIERLKNRTHRIEFERDSWHRRAAKMEAKRDEEFNRAERLAQRYIDTCEKLAASCRERDEALKRAEAMQDRLNRTAKLLGKEHERYQRLRERAEPLLFRAAIRRHDEALARQNQSTHCGPNGSDPIESPAVVFGAGDDDYLIEKALEEYNATPDPIDPGEGWRLCKLKEAEQWSHRAARRWFGMGDMPARIGIHGPCEEQYETAANEILLFRTRTAPNEPPSVEAVPNDKLCWVLWKSSSRAAWVKGRYARAWMNDLIAWTHYLPSDGDTPPECLMEVKS